MLSTTKSTKQTSVVSQERTVVVLVKDVVVLVEVMLVVVLVVIDVVYRRYGQDESVRQTAGDIGGCVSAGVVQRHPNLNMISYLRYIHI